VSDVTISLDNRVRLVTAVLAASQWPEIEQQQTPHAVHPHSKQTAYYVESAAGHTAVSTLNNGLARGVPLADYFTAALRCTWPDFIPQEPLPASLAGSIWVGSLPDFYRQTNLAAFWREEGEPWQTAYEELRAIFQNSKLPAFLRKLCGEELARVVIVPTVVYPLLQPVLAETAAALFMILPPAKAWGESPPWPFGEDPGWVIAQSCFHLVQHFLAGTLAQMDDTQRALLTYAAVTLCLEEEFDEAEAMTYLVQKKKEQNLPNLPLAVELLRDYLVERDGRSLLDLDL
jgi:hypothetical protein